MFACNIYKLFGYHFDCGFDLKKEWEANIYKRIHANEKTSLCDTYVFMFSFSSILDELTY